VLLLLEQNHTMKKTLLLLIFHSAFYILHSTAQPFPSQLNLAEQSPDSFSVAFTTTQGKFVMKVHRRWSPLAADRLFVLAKSHYYDGCVVYRVAETKSVKNGVVVQFGLCNDSVANRAWEKAGIKDEPVVHPHSKGSVCFARGGPDTRSTELAIMLTPCAELDTVNYEGVRGFPSFAEVISGMEVLEKFNRKYGNTVFEHEDSLYFGRDYFDRAYPGLDMIISVQILIGEKAAMKD
jgi:peptidyl-prolyl cis-trans isomerase A (cyclophilin A)